MQIHREIESIGEEVLVDAGEVTLEGYLGIPEATAGLIVFAHGSGSGRDSPRNRSVALTLRSAYFATLLLDLLTIDEEGVGDAKRAARFDLERLSARLAATIDWVRRRADLRRLPLGLFGASTGAAAALRVAAERPEQVGAAVSRGGRVDLAGEALARVRAPTLLIVGELDRAVRSANEEALARLGGPKDLIVVPGASHLFEEPGTLDQAALRARDWFSLYLQAPLEPVE